MRELHGVVHVGYPGIDLKHRSLLFDRFHIWELRDDQYAKSAAFEAELDFLRLNQIVVDAPPLKLEDFAESLEQHHLHEGFAVVRALEDRIPAEDLHEVTLASVRDLVNRYLLTRIDQSPDCDLVPICETPLPEATAKAGASEHVDFTNLASIALQGLPAPDESCAWQDILDFKSETHDKQWAFRRWLHALATKQQTEAEIRDEIDWTLNEYTKAMAIHKIKASQSFVDVFIIMPLEIIENLVKFNWSKIARGALSVRKRKVELMDAEMKVPGRECAYVFDARKRFDNGWR